MSEGGREHDRCTGVMILGACRAGATALCGRGGTAEGAGAAEGADEEDLDGAHGRTVEVLVLLLNYQLVDL